MQYPAIAKHLGRARSSISRELRHAPGAGNYDANLACLQKRRPSHCAAAPADAACRRRAIRRG
ncbi:MAG: helix-turn-helix domain-containing protein [Massilia sp.]|nr:helix-turn-helix domain-containing protein [Massilia sp.]